MSTAPTSETITRFVFFVELLSIAEHHQVVEAWKNPDGTTGSRTESLGWFAHFGTQPPLSLFLGEERPDLSPGRYRLILEPER